MISKSCYENHIPETGDTISISHSECGDTRQRLYVTNKGYIVLAYCHNCQESGVMSSPKDEPLFRESKQQTMVDTGIEYPTVVQNNYPSDMEAYLIKNKVNVDDFHILGCGYIPDKHGVYLPIYRFANIGTQPDETKLLGYQIRSLTQRGPKYLTYLKDKTSVPRTFLSTATGGGFNESKYTVLVEDLLSGLATMRAGANTLVNYGVQVKPEFLSNFQARNWKKVVWLDNDNEQVRNQAQKIAKVWGMVTGLPIYQVDKEGDPKHCSTEAIQRILKDACR